MNVMPGDVVAVQGVGYVFRAFFVSGRQQTHSVVRRCSGLGHLGLQFSHKMGFRTVALSTSSDKKDLALQLGAHDYLDGSKVNTVEELQKMGGAKVIICS